MSSLLYKFIFWGWDALYLLGGRPFTKIARWLFIITCFCYILSPLFWVIYLVLLPLWCSIRYTIKGKKWPWYIMAVCPVVLWLTTKYFEDFYILFVNIILLFAFICFAGFIFRKKVMPKMMNTLAEILVAQDIEAGRINLNAEEVEATSSDSFSLEESSLDEEDDREAVAEDEAVDENGETGRGAE